MFSRNCMHLVVDEYSDFPYIVEIHSFMNTEYECKTMKQVYELIKEYEIDWIVKESDESENDPEIFWIHTVLPSTWVETYSEKAHFDFMYNVPPERR